MSNIHGTEVDFHDDTYNAKEFLRHHDNRHAAQDYLAQAKTDGEAYFYADGKKFTIKHEEGEGGEERFSVHSHH